MSGWWGQDSRVSTFEAVLIDLDRMDIIDENEISPLVSEYRFESCMYTKAETMGSVLNAKRLDYMQLGWILVWVLNYEDFITKRISYHDMKWENLDDMKKKDRFLSGLVEHGVYSQDALEESAVIKDTIEFSLLF